MDFRIGSASKGLRNFVTMIVGFSMGHVHWLERRSQLRYNVTGMKKMKTICSRHIALPKWAAILAAGLLCGAVALARASNANQSSASDTPDSTSKSADKDKRDDKSSRAGYHQTENSSYRWQRQTTGQRQRVFRYYTHRVLHRGLADLIQDNQDRVGEGAGDPARQNPDLVIAKGSHTFGKWYDIEKGGGSDPMSSNPRPTRTKLPLA